MHFLCHSLSPSLPFHYPALSSQSLTLFPFTVFPSPPSSDAHHSRGSLAYTSIGRNKTELQCRTEASQGGHTVLVNCTTGARDHLRGNCTTGWNQRPPEVELHHWGQRPPEVELHHWGQRPPEVELHHWGQRPPEAELHHWGQRPPEVELHHWGQRPPEVELHHWGQRPPEGELHHWGQRPPEVELHHWGQRPPEVELHHWGQRPPEVELHHWGQRPPEAELHHWGQRPPEVELHHWGQRPPEVELHHWGQRPPEVELHHWGQRPPEVEPVCKGSKAKQMTALDDSITRRMQGECVCVCGGGGGGASLSKCVWCVCWQVHVPTMTFSIATFADRSTIRQQTICAQLLTKKMIVHKNFCIKLLFIPSQCWASTSLTNSCLLFTAFHALSLSLSLTCRRRCLAFCNHQGNSDHGNKVVSGMHVAAISPSSPPASLAARLPTC